MSAEKYISIGEFEVLKSSNTPYKGYVIGLGYAYFDTLTKEINSATSYDNDYSLFADLVFVQYLDTSKEARIESIPPAYSSEEKAKLSSDARTVLFGLRYPVAALNIGRYSRGSTNISTNAVRFSTRKGVLKELKSMQGEGTQVNAFRHVLWQSYITNLYGENLAREAGYAHEENPFPDLSKRRFKSLHEADQTIDLLNNIIGRDLGRRISQSQDKVGMRTMAIEVLKRFLETGLYTANQHADGTWFIDLTRITDEQYNELLEFYQTLNDYGRTEEEQKEMDEKEKRDLESQEATWGTMK